MNTLAALFLLLVFGGPVESRGIPAPVQAAPSLPASVSSLAVHNVRAAHAITSGAGSRVGILASSFAEDAHPELYAATVVLPGGTPTHRSDRESYEGYWTALALRDVAPEAEIYGLIIEGKTENERLVALEAALDWAVEHSLDAITYCAGQFSPSARNRLGPAIDRAVEAGVVVVFLGYDHPRNLRPGSFQARPEVSAPSADLDIYNYDCTVVLADTFVALLESDDNPIQRFKPFLARPSRGALTAGLVALIRSVRPDLPPSGVKAVLRKTSRPMVVQGRIGRHAPDALKAVSALGEASP